MNGDGGVVGLMNSANKQPSGFNNSFVEYFSGTYYDQSGDIYSTLPVTYAVSLRPNLDLWSFMDYAPNLADFAPSSLLLGDFKDSRS